MTNPLTSDIADLKQRSQRIRARLVQMSHQTGAPHLGSSLSCVDILVAAYFGFVALDPQHPDDPDRDRFILSKGHAAPALYATLAERGVIPSDWLAEFACDGSRLPEQMSPGCAPGIEAATGSLGHGLSLGAGMALAARIRQRPYRVWTVLSDGECNEGSVWEAAMFAAAQKLDRLVAVVDYNGWQATGRSDEVLALSPLKDKWTAFGWNTYEVDGHDIEQLQGALADAAQSSGRPSCLIARTIKGKGISFMEDDNNWHYRIPNADEVQAALVELGQADPNTSGSHHTGGLPQ